MLGCGQRGERVGDDRGPGDRRGAEARVAALLDAAVHVDHRRFDRGVAAGRQGARRAGIDVDAAGELDARVAREAQGPAGRRVEDDDRLADRDRAGGAVAGEEVAVAGVGRLDRVGAGRQARRRECGRARRERDAAGRQVGAGRGVVEVDGSGGRARARRIGRDRRREGDGLPDVREARRCAGGRSWCCPC